MCTLGEYVKLQRVTQDQDQTQDLGLGGKATQRATIGIQINKQCLGLSCSCNKKETHRAWLIQK